MKGNIIYAFVISTSLLLAYSCGSDNTKDSANSSDTSNTSASSSGETANPKGVGPHQNVQLTHPLDEKMIAAPNGGLSNNISL